jgi:TonB family protein
VNRTAALAAVVVLICASSCRKKKVHLDAIDKVVVAPAIQDQSRPEPRPIGALLLEAQRRGNGFLISHVEIEYVGPDGVMDPAFAILDVWFAAPKGPVDDPNRKTGAPVPDKRVVKATQCPRVVWVKGRWETRTVSCGTNAMTLRCTPQWVWERAIARGAPRDAVAKLTVDATATFSESAPAWRFSIADSVRDVHFTASLPDDCGITVEAPDPTVAPDAPAADGLDRQMIMNGIGVVKPKVRACGNDTTAKGTVKVSVKVSPEGTVSAVVVKATPDEKLGSCVARAIRTAMFTPTKTGGSFSYPFVF